MYLSEEDRGKVGIMIFVEGCSNSNDGGPCTLIDAIKSYDFKRLSLYFRLYTY